MLDQHPSLQAEVAQQSMRDQRLKQTITQLKESNVELELKIYKQNLEQELFHEEDLARFNTVKEDAEALKDAERQLERELSSRQIRIRATHQETSAKEKV